MMFAIPTDSLDSLVVSGYEEKWAEMVKKWFVSDQNCKTPGNYNRNFTLRVSGLIF